MLSSILAQSGTITTGEIAICTGIALLLGLVIALVYTYRNPYTKSFILTIALLPVIIQSVIMVVNGNLGAGVAVMGAFSLVRFRSVPGGAREILTIFFAMATGLACGMGYVLYAALFTLVVCAATLLLTFLPFGEGQPRDKMLRVTIPEDLDYAHLFDDLFSTYTTRWTLEKVRTTNMGGLFELQYRITLKDVDLEKRFLDNLRKRNGNLKILCGSQVTARDEL